MSKARNTAHAGLGIITIINILLVLCLAVFSTLTLSSARSDAALSKINAEAAGAYYRADAAAAKLAAEFIGGTGTELIEAIPITEYQNLNIHLVRNDDGTIDVLEWSSGANEDSVLSYTEDTLPLIGAD